MLAATGRLLILPESPTQYNEQYFRKSRHNIQLYKVTLTNALFVLLVRGEPDACKGRNPAWGQVSSIMIFHDHNRSCHPSLRSGSLGPSRDTIDLYASGRTRLLTNAMCKFLCRLRRQSLFLCCGGHGRHSTGKNPRELPQAARSQNNCTSG